MGTTGAGSLRVAQLLPAAHVADATGDAARALARALRGAGHRAEIYALTVDPPLRREVRPFSKFSENADLVLLHFALPSPLSRALLQAEGRRGIVYHNLTPPEMLLPHCPDVARLTALGRRELEGLAEDGGIELAIGVSGFNAADLRRTGFARVAQLPLPVDLDRFREAGNPVLRRQLDRRGPLFLTVGRVAPNKALEDFLRIAAYYLEYISPKARFHVVGGHRGLEPYAAALMELHAELGLDRRVRLVGRVPHADLVAYYGSADAYVCTSRHEGFCVPLLEAMTADLPIVARRAGAVPETLGDAGILLDEDDPAIWAEVLERLVTEPSLRRPLIAAGRRRLRDFEPRRVLARWVESLERWAAGKLPAQDEGGSPRDDEDEGGFPSAGDDDGRPGETRAGKDGTG